MTTRDLFESAREAARDMKRSRSQLDGMEARAMSLGGGGVTGMPRAQRHDVNGTAASNALIDHEAMLRGLGFAED